MRGVIVGLGLSGLCLLLAWPQILFARHLGQPWLTREDPFGFAVVALLAGVLLGLLIAVVAGLSWLLG